MRRTRKSERWMAIRVSDNKYRVSDGITYSFNVDQEKRSCTCRKWQTSRMPCQHAIAPEKTRQMPDYYEMVHIYLRAEIYRVAYQSGFIYPLAPPPIWETPNQVEVLLPPIMEN